MGEITGGFVLGMVVGWLFAADATPPQRARASSIRNCEGRAYGNANVTGETDNTN